MWNKAEVCTVQGICLNESLKSRSPAAFPEGALLLAATADPYGMRYKGIWLCLHILARALGGNYVNFGVFELYGDPALRVRLLGLL